MHMWMNGIDRLFASKVLTFAPIGSKLFLGSMSSGAEDEFAHELTVKLRDFGGPTS